MSERCYLLEAELSEVFGGSTPRRYRKSSEDVEWERMTSQPGFDEAYQRFLRHPEGGHRVRIHELAKHPLWIKVNGEAR